MGVVRISRVIRGTLRHAGRACLHSFTGSLGLHPEKLVGAVVQVAAGVHIVDRAGQLDFDNAVLVDS